MGKTMSATYSQYIAQLLNEPPLLLVQLVLSHIPVTGNFVNYRAILESKYKHVVCRIPVCCNIARHHPNGKGVGRATIVLEIFKDLNPAREQDCCGVFDRVH